MLELLPTLRELVAIPSVNPMGRAVSGPEYFEHRLTDHLQGLFERLALTWWRQPISPLRENIFARLDGDPLPDRGGGVLVLEAHQDTVPVDGMTISPFDPLVRDGRVYGRGSCDIKGGMATMLHVLARLTTEKPSPRPTVIMACTVNEENGFTGAYGLCRLWNGEVNPIFPRRPDWAIVAEPTNLDVVVAHKGSIRWRCQTHGRAVHSSRPQQGINAIFHMGRVLAAFEKYAREVVPLLGEHPRCGRPTLSVGTITGGISVNTVPDACTIEIDRRLVPGEEPLKVWQHAVDFVTNEVKLGTAVEHSPPYLQGRGLNDTHNMPLAEELLAIIEKTLGRPSKAVGVPYGTDAATIAAAGVPCVVFGPGSIDQAHTADEWIAIKELEQAAEVLYQFVLSDD